MHGQPLHHVTGGVMGWCLECHVGFAMRVSRPIMLMPMPVAMPIHIKSIIECRARV